MVLRLPAAVLTASVFACSAGAPPVTSSSASPEPASRPAPDAGVPTDRLLPVDAAARAWVDSVLASLDVRRKAAQLVFPWMWGRYVPTGDPEWATLRARVEDAGVGGILTSLGPPVALADKLNRLQRLADVPLLIATDMEHGPGQRLTAGVLLPWGVELGGGTHFPPAMALGATDDPSLARELGRITAAEARAVGIHLDFAPVVDVNNNPANPIINTRSYGGDPQRVAAFGAAHVRGLQDHGMLATAKHFPGHGDVEEDTHLVPLILRIDAARADSIELVPYRAVIGAGAAAVMTAHIAFPALSGDATLPATLSPRMIDSLLVGELGFGGLVVTDALNMGAIVRRFGAGDAAVRALEAGADVLLQPADPLVVIDAVASAVESGRVTEARLDRSVRKVLEAKTRLGLHRRRTVDLSRVADVVGAPEHRARAAEIARRSITLVRDRSALVPLVPLRDRRILVVAHSDDVDPFVGRAFTRVLARDLAAVERAVLPAGAPVAAVDSLRRQADAADVVVVALDVRVRSGKGSLALAEPVAAAVRAIAERRPTIVVSLGSPYVLRQLPELGSYLIAWGSDEVSQVAAAEALVGRAPITGRLPIAIPPLHGRGDGLTRAAGLEPDPGPTGPARATGGPALDSATLDSIALTIRRAIETRVTPGAVVAVGRSGGPAWVRAIGRTDPAPEAPAVEPSTVYDLASLTKVVGTTSAVMTLVADGRMELDAPLARYLPGWSTGGTRGSVTIRRLLTHTAGLPPFVRFWHRSAGALRGRDAFVAAIDSIGPIRTPGERYVYSDLGFILLGAAVEAVTDTTLDGYLDARLWTPLGMDETGFNPTGDPGGGGTERGGLPLDRIAPTEVDTVFRHEHVHGVVHDENAFAMGGVAGHAGLFSTVPDLARFARMLLGAGRVDGRAVIQAATVARFTTRQPGWDRALGWDAAAGTTIAEPFSARAFGHTGFTGTSLWVDPDRDLYVILLTNRVNPTRARGGIGELRRAVHGLAVRAADRWGG